MSRIRFPESKLNDFDKDQRFIRRTVKLVFGVILLGFIAIISFNVFVGVKVYETVENVNNPPLGVSINKLYEQHEFNYTGKLSSIRFLKASDANTTVFYIIKDYNE